ncbi:hypothetical protein ES689_00105 [Frigoribacterium sp. ACAM 257]|uniref:hypothetical protein n=1 Tax=Frigoribacterium sp. ACAM 257 TaxID=2508998 RepID=UPI0011B9A3A0|nr:hypothetical protein [Frigoribacterium sp. ACAM 257]TWX39948.1 hypothetical protein ES689_00105 [Frigoribacterium sp. ACAM 257]
MSVDLRRLTHEGLVAAVGGRVGAAVRPTAAELDSFYVRERSVPAARIDTYPRRRRVRDVVASMAESVESATLAVQPARPLEVSYASFFVEPEAASARDDREMAVAS